MYRTMKLFENNDGIMDRPKSGASRDARTPQAIRAAKVRIDRKPLQKQRILLREMNIAKQSIYRILKHDLGLRGYKRQTKHLLTVALQQQYKRKSRALRHQYADIATDEFCLLTKKSSL